MATTPTPAPSEPGLFDAMTTGITGSFNWALHDLPGIINNGIGHMFMNDASRPYILLGMMATVVGLVFLVRCLIRMVPRIIVTASSASSYVATSPLKGKAQDLTDRFAHDGILSHLPTVLHLAFLTGAFLLLMKFTRKFRANIHHRSRVLSAFNRLTGNRLPRFMAPFPAQKKVKAARRNESDYQHQGSATINRGETLRLMPTSEAANKHFTEQYESKLISDVLGEAEDSWLKLDTNRTPERRMVMEIEWLRKSHLDDAANKREHQFMTAVRQFATQNLGVDLVSIPGMLEGEIQSLYEASGFVPRTIKARVGNPTAKRPSTGDSPTAFVYVKPEFTGNNHYGNGRRG